MYITRRIILRRRYESKNIFRKKYDFPNRYYYFLSFEDNGCDAILQKINNEWLLVDMLRNKNSKELMKIYVTLLILNKIIKKEEIETIKKKELEEKGLNHIEEKIKILKNSYNSWIEATLDDYNLELIFK